jgi:DNA-binding Lrp family transcriptional regulator
MPSDDQQRGARGDMNELTPIKASKENAFTGAKVHLDSFDLKILDALQKNARIANSKLALEVGLSESACFNRVRKLEKDRVISGYTTVLNQGAIASYILVYAHITLESHKYASCSKFEQIISATPNAIGCDYVAGQYDYIVTFICRDLTDYSDGMEEISAKHGGISHYVSQVVMKRVKTSPVTASYLIRERHCSGSWDSEG